MRRLALSNEAVADLRAIARYSEQAWGVDKRIQYVASIGAAMRRLCSYPGVGEVQSGTEPEVRRIIQGRHLIFYEVHETRIRIVRVLHDRMDISRRLSGKIIP